MLRLSGQCRMMSGGVRGSSDSESTGNQRGSGRTQNNQCPSLPFIVARYPGDQFISSRCLRDSYQSASSTRFHTPSLS
jgi:hypothetical protein